MRSESVIGVRSESVIGVGSVGVRSECDRCRECASVLYALPTSR